MKLELCSFFLLLFYLILCSITDIRMKIINLKISICFFTIGIVFFFITNGNFKILFINLFPALLLICFSILSKGAMGLGDGIIFFVMSFYFTQSATLFILFFALFFASIFSIILLLRHYSRKYSFAFAPFITLGFCCFSILNFLERGIL